jgi:hypothetical protein
LVKKTEGILGVKSVSMVEFRGFNLQCCPKFRGSNTLLAH